MSGFSELPASMSRNQKVSHWTWHGPSCSASLALRSLGLFILCLAVAHADMAVAMERGGSNYGWSALDGCNREPYHVVPFYDKNRITIDEQLSEMYAAGQRRLALEVFFMEGGRGGLADVSNGEFSESYKKNLAALLGTIKKIGYQELLIKFLPQGPNSIWKAGHEWSEWSEKLYREHFDALKDLRPILAASRLPYRIDLYSEAIPTKNQPIFLHYTQRLWQEYTRAFGKTDTVGFAIITNIRQDRFAQIPAVYGDNPPPALDLHFYHTPYESFINAHNRLMQIGYANVPWIIGEALYNDAQEADELARAIKDTGQRVLYLLQWPLARDNKCPAVNVAAPLKFDEYIKRGF